MEEQDLSNSILNPYHVLDKVICAWNKMTWDTPLQSMPVFGIKSSINPLGERYRRSCALGEFEGKNPEGFFTHLFPMSPAKGPPLPRILSITWPKKE